MGFDKPEFSFNIGDIQPIMKIKNVAFRKNLQILEKYRYLMYEEYSRGLYDISIC